jgi:outer membrane protein OmpA-like peptidoglycan-associated protein
MHHFALQFLAVVLMLAGLPSADAQMVREHDVKSLRSFHGPASRIRRSFQSDAEAQKVLRQVLAAAGLAGMEDRILIRASAETDNAEATIDKDERLIFYNAVFMQEIATKTRNYWSMVAILAHEVGHHVRFHTVIPGNEHKFELEADYQAGFILRRMGAKLEEAQAPFYQFAEVATLTHPDRAQRLQAVTLGWTDGGSGAAGPGPPQVAAVTPAPFPPPPTAPAFDSRAATLQIQEGLSRAGCFTASPTGTWGPLTQRAAARFNEVSLQTIATDRATPEAVAILSSLTARICPLECRSPQVELNGVCATVPPAVPALPAPPAMSSPASLPVGPPVATAAEDFTSKVGDLIYFESDSFELTPEGQKNVTRQANWLRQNSQHKVIVEGHDDDRRGRDKSQVLAAWRADTIRRALIALGVDGSRIYMVSRGQDRPVATCEDISCWSQNRRAHLVLRR